MNLILSQNELFMLRQLDDTWATPLMMGGCSRSHHSATLRKLVRLGLAETIQRFGQANARVDPRPGARGSRVYRISDQGRAMKSRIEYKDGAYSLNPTEQSNKANEREGGE